MVCHRDPERYALLYALVWRLPTASAHLLEIASDPLVLRLERMAQVGPPRPAQDARLRPLPADEVDGGERFVAWFEPDHFILEAPRNFSSSGSARMRLVDPDAGSARSTGTRRT